MTQSQRQVIGAGRVIDYESITVADTAVGLTSATAGDAVYALITTEDEPLRYRIDGTDPTATEGHSVAAGEEIILRSAEQIADFSAIREGASSATIRVTYMGA